MDHSAMGHSGATCYMSMLWNWNTIDSCFISESWHIKSTSMFAGSCVGVIVLVMTLELLRRLSKEYDRHILHQYQRHVASMSTYITAQSPKSTPPSDSCSPPVPALPTPPFRPNLFQQMVRATLHMFQFAVAYFIMLLAMYFNGYIIISIFIGAWIGAFIFSWESVSFSGGISVKEEATACCG
ncbi:related to copper transport protein [Rhynchosporium secalis]|uniref:Copper transport protein n=1 Tax=Rhynchosporium secalis TaxID=38038 RepID=A0A1E1MS84_RHYSE|nr:related to copper transport protein [Rhynchosporium secalis]